MKKQRLIETIKYQQENIELQAQAVKALQENVAIQNKRIALLTDYANGLLLKYAPHVVTLPVYGLNVPVMFEKQSVDD